jgi:ABC-type branched-subunit amino acid transport system substrate-binding protein
MTEAVVKAERPFVIDNDCQEEKSGLTVIGRGMVARAAGAQCTFQQGWRTKFGDPSKGQHSKILLFSAYGGVFMQMKFNTVMLAGLMAVGSLAWAQDVQVVRIGHVAPTSGPQAHYGRDNENGVRMAIEDLNGQNITIGGKRIRFELVAEDDAADPKQGTAAAQKLCDSRVAGVVGHLNSGTTIPASKIYND